MLSLNINHFCDHIKSLGYVCHIQDQTGQICVDLPVLDGTLPTFIRIYDTQDLFQIIVIYPMKITDGSLNTVSRLLHILNKEIDLPGFCLDETLNIVFYRMAFPALDGQIHKKLLDTMLVSVQNLSTQFIPPIAQAANGLIDLEELLKKAKEKKKDLESSVV